MKLPQFWSAPEANVFDVTRGAGRRPPAADAASATWAPIAEHRGVPAHAVDPPAWSNPRCPQSAWDARLPEMALAAWHRRRRRTSPATGKRHHQAASRHVSKDIAELIAAILVAAAREGVGGDPGPRPEGLEVHHAQERSLA
eukprot:CAMPEP_0168439494 /NCGR_PEP_ID=MMETSP0228-20121227/42493_1 /TAXON_ID=133427 /ORGANISM="Protoceratium reticulatum, Strain CCCM 535 (=CCMP 1889)" /LENGTH=141 /DNA_ID=CAMNT_0008453769 /DNA_START=174 /DNA_END=601 /DNA_ORIENTATION=+